MLIFNLIYLQHALCEIEAIRGAGAQIDRLWVQSPLEEMKYLFEFIFPFLRSEVEAKRGVENSAESGERSVLTLGSLYRHRVPSCVRDTA